MALGTSGTMFTSALWIEGLVGAVATFNYGLSSQGIEEVTRGVMVADFSRLLTEKSLNDDEWRQALTDAAAPQKDWPNRRFRTPGEI